MDDQHDLEQRDLEKRDLEKRLKTALARVEAPAWFEARVMNAAHEAAQRGAAKSEPARRPWWQWAAAATAAVFVIGVGSEWQHHASMERASMERIRMAHFEADQREAGEAAKAKLQLALRITSMKLVQIQQRIEEASQ